MQYGVSATVNFLAWDTANNVGKTGDSGNFTLRLIKDGGVAGAPTNAGSISEPDSTNLKGVYEITLTATEMQAAVITLGGVSSTSDIVIYPLFLTTTTPANYKADVSALATAAALATVDTIVDAIKAVTDNLPDSGALTSIATAAALATVDANVDSVLEDTGTTIPALINAGVDLKSTGLDNISATEPTGLATTFRGKVCQLWARWFQKGEQTAEEFKLYQSDETTVASTQALSDDGTTQTQGKAS